MKSEVDIHLSQIHLNSVFHNSWHLILNVPVLGLLRASLHFKNVKSQNNTHFLISAFNSFITFPVGQKFTYTHLYLASCNQILSRCVYRYDIYTWFYVCLHCPHRDLMALSSASCSCSFSLPPQKKKKKKNELQTTKPKQKKMAAICEAVLVWTFNCFSENNSVTGMPKMKAGQCCFYFTCVQWLNCTEDDLNVGHSQGCWESIVMGIFYRWRLDEADLWRSTFFFPEILDDFFLSLSLP